MTTNTLTIPKTSNNVLVALLASICAIGPLATDMYLPALPQMTLDFNTSAPIIQLTLTAWLIGLAFGQIVAGPLSDIFGRTKPLIIGLLFFIISSIFCIISSSIEIFIFARFIGGFAASSALVVSRAIASDIYKGTMLTKFLATVMIIQGLAPIIAPVLGGQLLRFFHWNSIFIVLTVFGIGIIFLSFFKYQETLPANKRLQADFSHISKVFLSLCARPYFSSLCAIQFFIFCSLFAYISGVPFMLQGIYNFSPQEVSLVFATIGIGMVIAGKITNILAGRVNDEKLLFIGLCQGLFFGILFLIGLILQLHIYVLIILLLLAQIALPLTASTSFSLAMRSQKKVAGSASALLGFFSNISGAIVAPIVGIGGTTTAIPTGLVIAIVNLLALLTFLCISKKYINTLVKSTEGTD